MTLPSEPKRVRASSRRLALLLRFALACALGIAAAVLVACGTTGKGLIPASSGGPPAEYIETVDQDAQEGNGNCAATEAALLKTDQDFAALPVSVDSGLRNNLRQGISNLRSVALSLCTQPWPDQAHHHHADDDHHDNTADDHHNRTDHADHQHPRRKNARSAGSRRNPGSGRRHAGSRGRPGQAAPAKAPAEPLPKKAKTVRAAANEQRAR